MKKLLVLTIILVSFVLAMGEPPKAPPDGKTHRINETLQFNAKEEGVNAEAQLFSSAKTGLKLVEGIIYTSERKDKKEDPEFPYEVFSTVLSFDRLDDSLEWDSIDFLLYFYDASGVALNKDAISYRMRPVKIQDNKLVLSIPDISYYFDKMPENIKVNIAVARPKEDTSLDNISHTHNAEWSFNPLAVCCFSLPFVSDAMAQDMLTLKKENVSYWQKFSTEKTGLRLVGARVKRMNDKTFYSRTEHTTEFNNRSFSYNTYNEKSHEDNSNSYYVELDVERLNPTLELKSIEYLVTFFDENQNNVAQKKITRQPRFNKENITYSTNGGKSYSIRREPKNFSVQILQYTTADGKEVKF